MSRLSLKIREPSYFLRVRVVQIRGRFVNIDLMLEMG